MIGKLTGKIDSLHDGYLLLDVGGVGYLIFASRQTLESLGQKGADVSLLIDTHVREDHIHLYGFAQAEEQHWFRLLTSVQGVGVRAALAILSVCGPQELSLSIAAQDKALITRADGVGPKLATRIITELKDKTGKLNTTQQTIHKESSSGATPVSVENDVQDALQALIGLGYGRGEAYTAVMQAKTDSNGPRTLQELIRLSLKELSNEVA